jgi:hypothetical protein
MRKRGFDSNTLRQRVGCANVFDGAKGVNRERSAEKRLAKKRLAGRRLAKAGSLADILAAVDYERTGRKLGTGLKVLGRMAKQRLDEAGSPPAPQAVTGQNAASHETVPLPKVAASIPFTGNAVREGGRQFGKAVVGPFAKAGHVLWLETVGLFFALFAVGFLAEGWKLRQQWRSGPEHGKFVAYAALVLVFGYFCATSFVRARRRDRR